VRGACCESLAGRCTKSTLGSNGRERELAGLPGSNDYGERGSSASSLAYFDLIFLDCALESC
jgi:hypothetical protein